MKYDDATLLRIINDGKRSIRRTVDAGTWALVALLVVVVGALVLIPTIPGAEPGFDRTIQDQVRAAKAHCSTVWVEHKVKPAGADEVIAVGCRG